jgi:hypothetical protein
VGMLAGELADGDGAVGDDGAVAVSRTDGVGGAAVLDLWLLAHALAVISVMASRKGSVSPARYRRRRHWRLGCEFISWNLEAELL